MKDKYTEATSVDDTKNLAERDLNVEDVQNDCVDSRKREPGEGDDETQGKALNKITADLNKLEIESDDEFTERGPTGGIAVSMAMPNIAQKHLPMGPVMGVYAPPQQYYGMVNQQEATGGRRRHTDDIDDPAHKYFKPPKPTAFPEPVMAQNHKRFYNIQNFPGDMDDQQLTQPMMNPSMFNICGSADYRQPNCSDQRFTITTTIKNQNALTGGDVTVQSPISAGINQFPNNIVDDFLETLDKTPSNYYDPLCTSNYLGNGTTNSVLAPNNGNNISTLQPNNGSLNTGNNYVYSTTEFHGLNFEVRRHSDPSESGIESEGGSPWSDQAPSPSSIYTNPSSVDSGCGQSPMHESQVLPGISPPQYPHIVSPMGYSTTPSPESSSGCDSPGHPVSDVEDTGNFFRNAENLADLDVAIQVINEDMQQDEWKKKQNSSALHSRNTFPVQPLIPSTVMLPGMVITPTTQYQTINRQRAQAVHQRQKIVLGYSNVGIPTQTMAPHGMTMPATVTTTPHGMTMPATVTTTAHGMAMAPVVTTTQQVILIPPHNHTANSPLILVPVQTKPPPQKDTATKYKRILPKMPQPSTAPTSGIQLKKPDIVMAEKSPATINDVIAQHSSSENTNIKEQQPHQRQLMIARRTVASISREDLKKSDDEGDTYLHIAVCKADRYMVQALLERLHRENLDALVDQENNRRQTPLYLAVFINQPVMVSMFVQFQANVNVLAQNLSIDGQTTEVKAAIHVAASQGYEYHRTLIELLKAKDINVNIVNNNGQTALHCAILAHNKAKMNNSSERIQSVQIIETLIRAGAEPSAQDKKSGKTPLMYAIEKGDLTLVEIILKTVDPSKVKNVVKTQAFDGSSCLKIAESLKDSFEMEIWNKLWNSLQSAANGSMARAVQYQSAVY